MPRCIGTVRACGGHRGLDHPHSQDSSLPIHHLLINTDRFTSVATGKVQSVCVTRSECSKQAADNTECARGEVVLTCECVLCVGNNIPTTTTAETTGSNPILTHTHSHNYIL